MNVWHWSFDPIAFAIGPLSVHWYGICWALAFLSAEWLSRRLLRSIGRGDVDLQSLILWAFLGTVVGARLVHCVFYDPAYYLAHPLKVLALWEGGMASHGGAIGLILALAWAAPRYAPGLPLLTLLDVAAIPAALGGAIIRVANFLNSEIVGMPVPAGHWGVVFDQVDALPRYPVQLFEAAAYLLIAALLWGLHARAAALMRRGLLTGCFLALVFSARLVLEAWKTPQAAYEAGHAITVGQWLSLPFIGLGLLLIALSRRRAHPP